MFITLAILSAIVALVGLYLLIESDCVATGVGLFVTGLGLLMFLLFPYGLLFVHETQTVEVKPTELIVHKLNWKNVFEYDGMAFSSSEICSNNLTNVKYIIEYNRYGGIMAKYLKSDNCVDKIHLVAGF